MTAAPAPVFELEEVVKTFPVGRSFFARQTLVAIDGVSLTIRKGDILGVVGESGSGKTTLSKLMLGLLKPTSGRILLDGRPVADQPRRAIASRVQFVFQDPFSSLNPRRTIGEIVAQPLRIHGIGTRIERERRAQELLDTVGLPSRVFHSYPGQLSGGQRQRAVIARALALKPQILICDEPTSALDVSVQAQILNLLLDLRREHDLTYVLVSHNLSVVEHMATTVAVMYLGRIVELDEADRLFRNPRHPYTRILLGSAMTIAPGAGVPELRLRGALPNPTQIPTGCRFHPRCPDAVQICRTTTPVSRVSHGSLVECHLAEGPWEAPARDVDPSAASLSDDVARGSSGSQIAAAASAGMIRGGLHNG